MAQRVVDLLEVVEVEQRDPDLPALAAGPGERLPEPVLEQEPVRQAGQLVVVREPVGTLLGRHPVGHVLDQQQGRLRAARLAGHDRGVDAAVPDLTRSGAAAQGRRCAEAAPEQVAAEQDRLVAVGLVDQAELLERAPGRLGGRPAEDRLGLAGPGLDAPSLVVAGTAGELDDRERGVVHVPGQPLVRAPQLRLGRLARGQVAAHDLDRRPAIEQHLGRRDLDRERGPVQPAVGELGGADLRARLGQGGRAGASERQAGGVDEVEHGVPDQLCWRAGAEEPGCLHVGENHDAFPVGEDGGGRGLDQRPVASLALAQSLVGPAALGGIGEACRPPAPAGRHRRRTPAQ